MGRCYVLVIAATLLAAGCSGWCSQNPQECLAAFQQGRAAMAPAPSTALPMCYEVEPYTRNVPCRQF